MCNPADPTSLQCEQPHTDWGLCFAQCDQNDMVHVSKEQSALKELLGKEGERQMWPVERKGTEKNQIDRKLGFDSILLEFTTEFQTKNLSRNFNSIFIELYYSSTSFACIAVKKWLHLLLCTNRERLQQSCPADEVLEKGGSKMTNQRLAKHPERDRAKENRGA